MEVAALRRHIAVTQMMTAHVMMNKRHADNRVVETMTVRPDMVS